VVKAIVVFAREINGQKLTKLKLRHTTGNRGVLK
jgi:hypothetical protein